MNAKHLLLAIALSANSFITNVSAAPTVFFGEDLGAGSAASIPNSIAARNAFVSRLTSFGLQNFESFSAGDIFPGCCGPLTFSGSSVTANITGGRILDAPFNERFAISGTDYLNSSFNQRLTFSSPVAAFGVFVVDANETDNNPATATQNGQLLSPAEIEARPFDTIDGIFRIVTERSPGVFELLFDSGTFPAPSSSALFAGLIDAANPFSNLIFINGTSGLDEAFQDGFGYDDLMLATSDQVKRVPEPGSLSLLGLALSGLVFIRRRFS